MTLLASLRDWLKAQQLDAVLLSSRQNKQPHLGISTGSGYVVISRESAHILVDSRYYAECRSPHARLPAAFARRDAHACHHRQTNHCR